MNIFRTKRVTKLLAASIFLLIACQDGQVYERREIASGSSNSAAPTGDAVDGNGPGEADEEAAEEAAEAPAAYTMAWDNAADPAIQSYKVFILPPDNGTATYKNLSGVPIEVKNIPVADLVADGAQQKVSISDAEIKAALGVIEIDPALYCFSLVAVNAVGNSVHTTKSCL